MKKKTLSLFLVLIMCLSLMPAGVFAQDAVQEQTPEQTETVIDPEQQEPDSEPEEAVGDEQDEEEAQVTENDAVAALQTMIDDLPEQVTEENADAVTAQLATIEDAMEDMTDEQLDKLEADRYEAAVAALAQLGGGDTPAIMAAANAVTKYDLWVGGVQVTSENKDRIPGVSSGKASYDPDTKILTLDNATIRNAYTYQGGYGTWASSIYAQSVIYNLSTIKLIGNNYVTENSNVSGSIPIYVGGDFSSSYPFTITGDGTLNVTTRYDSSVNRQWGIDVSADLIVDNTKVKITVQKPRIENQFASALAGGDLILKGTKVSYAVKKMDSSSSPFLYSKIEDYRVLEIVPKSGHEHYLCGEQYECDYYHSHTEESELTKFSEWSDLKDLPTEGNYYLSNDVTLDSTWRPTENVKLCLNGHKISGPDGFDVISVTNGIEVTVSDCGCDKAASSEAKIYHETGPSGNGVEVAGGAHSICTVARSPQISAV